MPYVSSNLTLPCATFTRLDSVLLQASVSLQTLFSLLPLVWELKLQWQDQRTSVTSCLSAERFSKIQLRFLADAFRWGSTSSQAVGRHWMLAMHKVSLQTIPPPPHPPFPPQQSKVLASQHIAVAPLQSPE